MKWIDDAKEINLFQRRYLVRFYQEELVSFSSQTPIRKSLLAGPSLIVFPKEFPTLGLEMELKASKVDLF